jgi:2-oxoisovalerate dehydrogenase E1 component
MVIRIAGLAYQKGFGGHFHNDNSFAVFRDIPGLILACPSNGADAVKMLRTCVKLAQQQQRLAVFLEPIALYMTKDLHEEGDGLWTSEYLSPESLTNDSIDTDSDLSHGIDSDELKISVHGKGKDVCIISYGNGYYLSRQAEKVLAAQEINCRVIDLRWLAPLDEQGIVEQALSCDHILVVDECRQTGSISEALVTLLHEAQNKYSQQGDSNAAPLSISRVTAKDSFIPLGSAAYHVLPAKQDIIEAAQALVNTKKHAKESVKITTKVRQKQEQA